MMLEDIDDWIPAPGDKGKEKSTATTKEKKKKKKKKKLAKNPGEGKTPHGEKGSTSTTAENQEPSPLSTSPPESVHPAPSPSTSSMSTPTSPLVSRSRRKDSLRWSSNEVPTRTAGSDIVRSKVDLLGDLESSGELDYYDVYDEGEGEGDEEGEGTAKKSAAGKAISAPDLSRARKVEMVVSKLYELGNTAPQKKKKRFLQRFGILGDMEQQQQVELKYKQLNDEIQSLSHELALSPRGSHASPVLSLKAMKLLGMVNLDVTSPRRRNQDSDDPESSEDLAGGSSPPSQSSPSSSSSSTATRSKPVSNNTAVPLKAMKMLGVMEGAGSSNSGKKSRSVIHRSGDRGPTTSTSPPNNSGNQAADDDNSSPEPVLSPLAMLLDWKGRRARSNSKEVSLLDSMTSSSSSESEASPHTVRVRRARTLSKEELTDSSVVQDTPDRRERRARTLSKGI